MKYKSLLSIGLLLSSSSTVFCQNRYIYFLKNDDSEVKKKEQADFIRVIEEPDSGSINYKLRKFFMKNSPKFIGSVSSFSPLLILDGPAITFNTNEKKSEKIIYSGGAPVKLAYYFHKNGRVKMGLEYPATVLPSTNIHSRPIEVRIITYYNSTGNQTVSDGNGFAIIENEAGLYTEEGRYRDGLGDSVWNGFLKDGSDQYFQDNFENNVFKWGNQTFENDRKVTYLKINEPAEFEGEMKNFYLFLQKNFQYPKDAREQRISGKITLNFLVKADGTTTFLKVYPLPTSSMPQRI